DLAINPLFGKALVEYITENCNFQVNGVTAANSLTHSVFVNTGNENFALSGSGPNAFGSDFGMSFAATDWRPTF
ncbi:TPA: hypothetical protein N4790_004371, partial [Shigella sonnei]|nr:hypothetical protein [Shigella sonnei]